MIRWVVIFKSLALLASFSIVACLFSGCLATATVFEGAIYDHKPLEHPESDCPPISPPVIEVSNYISGLQVNGGIWVLNHVDVAANITVTYKPLGTTPPEVTPLFETQWNIAQPDEWVYFPFSFITAEEAKLPEKFTFEVLVQNGNQTGAIQGETLQRWIITMR